jgi:RNAse (barnase) inhibitor barstar
MGDIKERIKVEELDVETAQKLLLLNLVMWSMQTIHSVDAVESVGWAFNHKVKYHAKQLVAEILKHYGKTLHQLWDNTDTTIPQVVQYLDQYTERMANTGYWMLPELIDYIDKAKEEYQKKMANDTSN